MGMKRRYGLYISWIIISYGEKNRFKRFQKFKMFKRLFLTFFKLLKLLKPFKLTFNRHQVLLHNRKYIISFISFYTIATSEMTEGRQDTKLFVEVKTGKTE